jgi:thymidylate synthase ThyX
MKIKEKTIGPVTLAEINTANGIEVQGVWVPEFPPELQAALGATLSRDHGSTDKRLENIFSNKEVERRIMDVYFKKYGHNSIGDMGFMIVSFNGLTMKGGFHTLEHRLFNGQEASTRYIDFENMGFMPISPEVDIQSKKLFSVYSSLKDDLIEYYINEGMNKTEAEPKAFDIAAAFLPLSARTNVFWVGSIRTYINQSRELKAMGGECSEIGEAMEAMVSHICPNSVRVLEDDRYIQDSLVQRDIIMDLMSRKIRVNTSGLDFSNFNLFYFAEYRKNLGNVIIPTDALSLFGNINAAFDIDFRSGRDTHRQRAFSMNTACSFVPNGIEDFYFNEIPKELLSSVKPIIQEILLESTDLDNGVYGMPMATKFPWIKSGNLPAWLYYLKLRSGPKVHPTLIPLVQGFGKEFEKILNLKDLYQRGDVDYGKRSDDANSVK